MRTKRKSKNQDHDLTVDMLQSQFNERKLRNARYSLRAYARDLKIDSSLLSKIIRGQRIVGPKLAIDLQKRISGQATSWTGNDQQFKTLDIEQFCLISEWYYDVILEVVHCADFKPDPEWIAKKLNIPVEIVRASVKLLFKMGLLIEGSKGQWFSTGMTSSLPLEVSEVAQKEHQKQLLNLAIQSIDTVDVSERDNTSIVMCIDSSKLLEAKKRIKKFRRDLMEYLEKPGKNSERDRVYHLVLALYPVSNK